MPPAPIKQISPRTSPITRRLLRSLASLPLVFVATAAAQSSLSWSSAGTASLGGAGLWDLSSSSWWNGASAVAWPATGTANAAVFGGTAGTVSVNGPISANSIGFSTTGYTLDGAQVLTLNGSIPAIDVASGASAIIGNSTPLQLAGTAGLRKTGAGSLTVTSSIGQALTGGIKVEDGTLILSLANLATPTDLFPAGNTLTVGAGTISITSKSGTNGSQTFANTVLTKGNAQIRVGHPVAGAPPAGTVTTLNLGTISRPTPGSVVRLNTAVGGFGTTASTVDRLFVTAPAAAGWLAPWAFSGDNVTNSPRFAYVNASGQILLVNGTTATAGTLANVTNAATVYTTTGTFNPAGPVTALGLQSNGALTINLGANNATFGGLIAIAANTASSFNSTGGVIQINPGRELFTTGLGTINFNAPVADNPGTPSHLTHVGVGTLNLSALNTYTGETNIVGGRLTVTETGKINASSGVFVNAGIFRQMNFTDALTSPVTLQGGRVEGYGNLTNLTVTNLAANTIANIGTSIAPLTAVNLTFQGAATLSPTLSTDPAALPLNVTGTLTTTPAAGKVSINPIAPGGAWSDGSTTYKVLSYGILNGVLADFVVGAASPSFSARQAAVLADEGGLITLTVSGDKALWTGAAGSAWTTGTVPSPFNWRTQTGGVGTQFLAGDDVVFDDTATSTNVLISDASVTTTNILVSNTTKDYTISANADYGITSGVLLKTGAGRLTLGGTNTRTGLTTIAEGTLSVGGPAAFQANGSMVLGSNSPTTSGTAILDLNGYNARLISLTSGSATTNTITNNGLGTGTNTLNLVLPTAALTSLVTDGPSRKTALSLGARAGIPTNLNNTFSGGFLMYGAAGGGEAVGCRLDLKTASNPNIESGILVSGPYGTGTITVGVDATDKAQFYVNTPNVTIANNLVINTALGTDIAGAFRVEDYGTVVNGSVVANKASVVVHHNGQFSAGPTAGGPLEQSAALAGQITFTGPILSGENPAAGFTVQQANLTTTKRIVAILANTTPTPSNYTGNTTLTAANVILRLGAAEQIPDGDGKGNVVFGGNATLDLNDFPETVNALSGAGFVENITGTAPVTLTVGAGNSTGQDFSGRIFDARLGAKISLTKVGTGTQILSNSHLYTGDTTITAGTLQLGNGGTAGALSPSSAIFNSGTLAINRSNAVVQGTDFSGAPLTGTGGLTKLGTGSLTLNAANTYTGPTLVSAGTLIAGGGASFGTTLVTLATGATFDISTLTAPALSLAGGLAGSGTVNATGKTLSVGGVFTPGALAVTGNLTLASGAATTLRAAASPANNSTVTVGGTLVNAGTLAIQADAGFAFAAGQSFTFATASTITRGFTGVSVGPVGLSSSAGGVWTGSADGLSYSYDENTATLAVAAGSALTPLQEWRLTNLGTSENTGEAADTFDKDNDGIVNLLEYALGGNPNMPDQSILPVATGGSPLSLTFTRVADPAITYIVEASDTLATDSWSPIYTNSGTPGTVTVADPGPVVGNRRFLRLRVETPLVP